MAARKRGGKEPPPGGEEAPALQSPWRVRFSEEILADDLGKIGHAALKIARSAIDKKLKVDPEQYGERLRSPLHGLFKLKASHVRIAYHIDRSAREVWVLMIGDRRDIWEQDQQAILDRLGLMREQSVSTPPQGQNPDKGNPR